MSEDVFDLIVLGAGSGGLATSLRAARHGARVALLEPAALGGTCVNVGCVPKKILWFAAQLAEAQGLARDYGFVFEPGPLDWMRLAARRQRYLDHTRASYARQLADADVAVLPLPGRLLAAGAVGTPDGRVLRAPHIVIAAGARPHRPELPGAELGLLSHDMFALRAPPRRLAIVGGGYIAVEFAGLMHALGSEVDLLVRGRLLAGFDAELVQALTQQMLARGVRIRLDTEVRGARHAPDGIVLDTAGGELGGYDTLLWATGRVPNRHGLGLEAAGVALDGQGHVMVDDWQDTNVPGIHAVGDITDRKALTPVATGAGRRLAERLFGGRPAARLDYTVIPSVLFAEPPLAMAGLTEAQARERHGEAVRVYRQRFVPMQLAVAERAESSVMKVVCAGEDEQVVGIHVLGPGADEMLQGFAVAMRLGLRRMDLQETIAIHPSSAEELLMPR